MTLEFRLRFFSRFGQTLYLRGNRDWLGGGSAALPLHCQSEGCWQVTLPWPGQAPMDADLSYSYVLREADGTRTEDLGASRTINLSKLALSGTNRLVIIDSWNYAGFFANAFSTEPFRQVLLKPNQTEVKAPAPANVTHTFQVKAPLLAKGQTLCLLGAGPMLGDWNTAAPILLNRRAGEDYLWADLNLRGQSFPIAYKYGVYDVERRAFVRYEDGPNRSLADTVEPGKQTLVDDGFAVLPADTWRGAGVAIPVFSLRSQNSFGVGEFTDLKLLADWCQQAGLKLVQVLPINDTIVTHTNADSYPYSAISAFALHPMYLNLGRVANARNQKLLKPLEPQRQKLNSLAKLDYETVVRAKLEFVRQIYPSQKAETFASPAFKRFFEDNQLWLQSYARFCCLRDRKSAECGVRSAELNAKRGSRTSAGRKNERSRTEPTSSMPEPAIAGDCPEKENYTPSDDELGFYYFIQFHLHLQLREAAEYAHSRGVILKGDIAIGVSRFGADVWQQPELYHLDMQAGAPPDAFAVKGQNWSFPTYNWGRMQETGFDWWHRRFEQMSRYFDAFRIDHILGFFRIWSVPVDSVEGIMGHFVPAIPVGLHEFLERGIALDHRRFTKPYISNAVLEQLFGADLSWVKEHFLLEERFGGFSLKPEFATQRQVEQHFAGQEKSKRNERAKLGLYDLISNVILFEVDGSMGRQYHFRFAMQDTLSFKYLDDLTQARLRDLYNDYFFRRQDAFWLREALQKLPALKRATNMLICGEDLGLVPGCVPQVMRDLGLLSLEIQRMPKALNCVFSRPKDAPYLSVVSPSTHDMSTIRGWWREDRKVTETFYRQELHGTGEAPLECETWINREVVAQHLASPALWSIFQLQDLLGIDEKLRRANPDDERINIPADPHHYWCYRMHLTLEQLLSAREFNEDLRGLVRENGR